MKTQTPSPKRSLVHGKALSRSRFAQTGTKPSQGYGGPVTRFRPTKSVASSYQKALRLASTVIDRSRPSIRDDNLSLNRNKRLEATLINAVSPPSETTWLVPDLGYMALGTGMVGVSIVFFPATLGTAAVLAGGGLAASGSFFFIRGSVGLAGDLSLSSTANRELHSTLHVFSLPGLGGLVATVPLQLSGIDANPLKVAQFFDGLDTAIGPLLPTRTIDPFKIDSTTLFNYIPSAYQVTTDYIWPTDQQPSSPPPSQNDFRFYDTTTEPQPAFSINNDGYSFSIIIPF